MTCGYAKLEHDVRNWSGVLWGTPCSRGIAVGLVQRVHGGQQPVVHNDWPNEPRILVTDTADPKAVELAPFTAVGVVTECGGTGSNLAILLRELEVPAVMGVAGVCRRLEDGMTVLVDGNKGLVLVLTEPLPLDHITGYLPVVIPRLARHRDVAGAVSVLGCGLVAASTRDRAS